MNWDEMIQKRRQKEQQAAGLIGKVKCSEHSLFAIDQAAWRLSPLERSAALHRFLEGLPIARVADQMGMSWDGADELIDRTVQKLEPILCRPKKIAFEKPIKSKWRRIYESYKKSVQRTLSKAF